MLREFDMEEQSAIALAPYIKNSMRLIKLFGCMWDLQWVKDVPLINRHRRRLFLVFFWGTMLFLVVSCIYISMTEQKELSIRETALSVNIWSYHLQVFVLFVKWNDFCSLVTEAPRFSNKPVIEAELKHSFKIIKPWTVLKLIVYLGITISFRSVILTRLSSLIEGVDEELTKSQNWITISFGLWVRGVRYYNFVSMLVFQFGASLLIMALLLFINGYLNHLKCSIVRVRIRDPLQINTNWIEDYENIEKGYDIRYCVFIHQYIIRIVDLTNSVFSWVLQLMIWQTLYSLMTAIKVVQTDDSAALRATHLTAIYMTEMFCYCYLGNDIQLKSEQLATTCLEKLYGAGDMIIGDWKSLQVMAVRCQTQPLTIKGGPFYILNLRTFIAMIAVVLTLISFSK